MTTRNRRSSRRAVASAPSASDVAASDAPVDTAAANLAADSGPTVDATPAPAVDAAPADAPTTTPDATPDAAAAVRAARRIPHAPALPDVNGVHPSMTFSGLYLNGTPGDASDLPVLNPSPNAPFAADPLTLLTLAARLLASCGATIPANDVPPADAFLPLAAHYLGNRATRTCPNPSTLGYFPDANSCRVTDTDLLYYPTRAAMRLAYRAAGSDRTLRAAVNALPGGFNSRVNATARRDALASLVASRLASLTTPADSAAAS